MFANLKYLKYVLKHKWFLIVANIKYDLKVTWRQLLLHDLTKFSKIEWKGYVNKFHRNNTTGWEIALYHHYEHNEHHWNFWVVGDTVYPMPEYFIREMIADWMSAGRCISGEWDHVSWYLRNRNKMNLHPSTRVLVEILLPGFHPTLIKAVVV